MKNKLYVWATITPIVGFACYTICWTWQMAFGNIYRKAFEWLYFFMIALTLPCIMFMIIVAINGMLGNKQISTKKKIFYIST